METYHYVHHKDGEGEVKADTDDGALEALREKYGEHMVGVSIVFQEELIGKNYRTIWME